MAELPDEYRGREQTWLKHRVLEEYLQAWAHKLGSIEEHAVHLWYVDCFAGPWESADVQRSDTSVAIGLRALNQAAATWAAKGRRIALHAVFVEQDGAAFEALQGYVAQAADRVDAHCLFGAFGAHVDAIDRLVGKNPAFLFVDPKGWRGADLGFIARLGGPALRDVMVNVMYDHLNRFKDDRRAFLVQQMRDFFGLGGEDLPAGLDEHHLMALYRERLARVGGIEWVADLAVPVPTRDRTKFRLVVAGHHPAVIELFRDVERKVIGVEAAHVRPQAKARADEARTRQPALLTAVPRPADPRYADDRALAVERVRDLVPELVRAGPRRFGDLWPSLLCEHHLTLTDLRHVVSELAAAGVVEIRGLVPPKRKILDQHVLALVVR